ncbi:MAG TPA: flagellar basal body L-ring protein FlgH [Rhizomicrobium sp.]|nr:flagellar basal body L-ring protein FlgH [Rhizomicrobium sp.]
MRKTRWKECAGVVALVAALGGCNTLDRLQNVGAEPKLSPITNPAQQKVSLPMPQEPTTPRQASSLWQTGSHSFFPDPRASHVGDIITVDITIADSGQISNTTQRSRNNSDAANLTNFFGLENSGLLAADKGSLVNMGSTTSNVGAGSVNRSEAINLTLAALVTQILPNGNMVISGHQQVKVNAEMRDLEISGVVRQEDITQTNTVNLAQVAEARLSYGGQGQITDVQQPRYGSQLFDILMPF